MSQPEKAERLRSLHHGPPILVLPNAWDAASARIIEDAGFLAVATTSAGIALSMGYPDGQRISREEMIAAVHRIASAVHVPVTADVEAGYGDTPEAVAGTVRAVLAAGAVGINLEDSWERGGRPALADIALQEERIRAARGAAESAGVPLVMNARTDVFLHSFGEESTRFDEAVRRLNGYLGAGADCGFPIGVRDDQRAGEHSRRPGCAGDSGARAPRRGTRELRLRLDVCRARAHAPHRERSESERRLHKFSGRHDPVPGSEPSV